MIKLSCNMPKHLGQLWSIETVESFMPVYPTSIRGLNLVLDQRKPGNR